MLAVYARSTLRRVGFGQHYEGLCVTETQERVHPLDLQPAGLHQLSQVR